MLHDTKSNFEEETFKFNFFFIQKSTKYQKIHSALLLQMCNTGLSFFNFRDATVTFRCIVPPEKKPNQILNPFEVVELRIAANLWAL